jgi:hypothetical protein
MSRKELETVLDFILNRASGPEFDVIAKACERRVRDKTAFARLGGTGPAAMARGMSEELQRSMGSSLENVRATVKDFVADIIRKNAPEIPEDQLETLLREYVPEAGEAKKADLRGVAAQALPPEAVLGMVLSFVEYSEGRMAPSRQRELWETNPRWQDEYWAAFPAEVKAIVKAYLEGKLDGDTFGSGILSVLGL